MPTVTMGIISMSMSAMSAMSGMSAMSMTMVAMSGRVTVGRMAVAVAVTVVIVAMASVPVLSIVAMIGTVGHGFVMIIVHDGLSPA